MPRKCQECERPTEDCVCSFDFIPDIPRFIQDRVSTVTKHHKNQVVTVRRTVRLINLIIDALPLCYATRSGCEVEEYPMQEHSEHDTARIMGALLVAELNELVVNLCSGSHNSALRTVRSLLEWLVKAAAAVSDLQIFVNRPEYANKAVCLRGLLLAARWYKARRKYKEPKQRELLKMSQNISSAYLTRVADFLIRAKIPDGVGKIPNSLNDKIMSNMKEQDPKTWKITEGSALLYTIYDQLSQSVHNEPFKLDDIPYGGLTEFHDQQRFDESYRVLYRAVDVILYLYLVLVDIDVFHGSDNKKRYRDYAQKTFAEIFVNGEFDICRTLFNSKTWNDPSLEFTYPVNR